MKDILAFYRGKRVFVTGHTGFKGTWLCRVLHIAGANVTGYALKPPTEPSLFAQTETDTLIGSIEGDVRDLQSVVSSMKAARPEIVFHLAAQPIVRASYREPAMTFETNVMGTVNMLEGVRATASVKSVVNVTTDKVYENKEWVWGYREDENLCGYDPYSNSKSCSELVTASYRNSFFSDRGSPAISTARSGNVIGGGDYAADRIIPDCVRAVRDGRTITIRNPHSIRPYQHVLDCLSGYLLLGKLQYENGAGYAGSYNFGPGESSNVTTADLVGLFCDSWGTGAKWKSEIDADAVHEANFLRLDCAKAKSVLGWKPAWNIETAVRMTVDWSKAVARGESAAEITDAQINEYYTGA